MPTHALACGQQPWAHSGEACCHPRVDGVVCGAQDSPPGALYITNYRLMWTCTGMPNVSIPLAHIDRVELPSSEGGGFRSGFLGSYVLALWGGGRSSSSRSPVPQSPGSSCSGDTGTDLSLCLILKDGGVKRLVLPDPTSLGMLLTALREVASPHSSPTPPSIVGRRAGHSPSVILRCTPTTTIPQPNLNSFPQTTSREEFFVADPYQEYRRMGCMDEGSGWRVTTINSDYELCATYPSVLCVPSVTSDDVLRASALFRAQDRLPVLSWRCPRTGLAICRSAQPHIGVTRRRSSGDEQILRDIAGACGGSDVFVFDCRPRVSAYANQVGNIGGCEGTGYALSGVQFGGIPNIHIVRSTLTHLQEQEYEDTQRKQGVEQREAESLKLVESVQGPWSQLLNTILEGASKVAEAIRVNERAVLVHCSDGWDRTPQVCALAQIMLDEECRTMKGFIRLIEREWLWFGHRFGDRCGNCEGFTPMESSTGQRSPIFLQFLWCVMQLSLQRPGMFEFNSRFLWCLRKHHLSSRFGNFFGNSEQERARLRLWERTPSLWAHMAERAAGKYRSVIYKPVQGVVYPDFTSGPRVCVWSRKSQMREGDMYGILMMGLLEDKRFLQAENRRLHTELAFFREREGIRERALRAREDVVEEVDVSDTTVLLTMVPAPRPVWQSEIKVVENHFDLLPGSTVRHGTDVRHSSGTSD